MGQSAKKKQFKIYSKNRANWLKRNKIRKQNIEVLNKLKVERLEETFQFVKNEE